MTTTITDIPLENLSESPTNPRKHFDPVQLQELAESIKAKGVIDSILVREIAKNRGNFEVVTGARRFRASKLAGMTSIPARIRDLSDEDVLEIQVIENLQRADVHPLDEALGYEQLIKRNKLTTARIAAKVGKSQAYVEQRLKLPSLIPPARQAFWEGRLSLSHAILIARLQPAEQARSIAFALKTWVEYDGDFDPGVINIRPDEDIRELDAKRTDDAQTVCSVADLKAFIEKNILLDLRNAAFDKKDPALHAKAGSCIDCPKRTGFSKELFNDIGKADICTDPACFQVKQANHLAQVKVQLKKEKKRFVEITRDRRKPPGFPGAITYRSFKEIKGKPCARAKVGILVDGNEKGKTLTICNDKSCPTHYGGRKESDLSDMREPSPAAERQLTPRQKWEWEREEFANEGFDEVMQDRLIDALKKTSEGVALLATLVAKQRGSTYTFNEVKKALGFKGNVENWSPTHRRLALYVATWMDAFQNTYEPEDLTKAFKVLGIDPEKVINERRSEYEKEYPAPKDVPKKGEPGCCRICGCTEEKACTLKPSGNKPVRGCSWADKTRTLCDNPKCVAAAKKGASKSSPKKKGKKGGKGK